MIEEISIHALLAESDQTVWPATRRGVEFLSTLSLRRATTPARILSRLLLISIHALLAESDSTDASSFLMRSVFLSTLSLRRATPHDAKGPGCVFYFYPRSPCGERLKDTTARQQINDISIHALLAESDICGSKTAKKGITISIHALLAESDSAAPLARRGHWPFLSTLSLRRATRVRKTAKSGITFLSTLSLRRATGTLSTRIIGFSGFLSTLSLRRAT